MHGVVQYDISPIRGPLANAFVILINALFFNVKLIGILDVYPRDFSQGLLNEEETTFDFIIVGAGAAGCAAANRISEESQWSVLLIEAGDYPSPTTEVPGLYMTVVDSSEDWQFRMEKETKACKALNGERCSISRGKVLGGTSTINNMMYVRGLSGDFDKNNFESWDGNFTHGAMEQLENYQGNVSYSFPHGKCGPIHLEFHDYNSSARDMLLEAYKATGYIKMPKREAIGHKRHLSIIRNGARFNMAKAFLTPVKDRANLFFTKNTEVEAIGITEPVDKRASGVNVSVDGVKFFLRAKKEVILTAGAINNAKLLLLSGVGAKKYLMNKKNLPFHADVPGVGRNLQFHLTVPLYVAFEPKCGANTARRYTEADVIQDTFDYVMHRSGNFSHTNLNAFVNYILTRKTGTTLPNLALHHLYFKIGDRNLMAWIDGMHYHPRIINALLNFNKEREIIVFLVTLINPLSRGEVLLNETYFLGNPSIRGNFLSDDENWDYMNLLSGFNYVTNLTDVMVKNKAEFLNLDVPDCRNYKFCTERYVLCYIHNMAYPNGDVVGTTRMGAECEPDAVVRENLEVRKVGLKKGHSTMLIDCPMSGYKAGDTEPILYKVRCLRVADSSVLGYIPLGNTMATDAMIGNQLGDILKAKWVKGYVLPENETHQAHLVTHQRQTGKRGVDE